MAGVDGPAYAFLYWDAIDRAGHETGPDSPAFDEAAHAALDAIADRLEDLRDVTVLLTADHGQVPVSPDRVDHLDELRPELPGDAVPAAARRLLTRCLPARARGARRDGAGRAAGAP